MPGVPDTVTDALALLASEGYTADFNLRLGAAVCPGCRASHDLEHSVIDQQFRFEGDSDPGDEAIVLGLRCPVCGAKGVIVSAFGPDADPDLFAFLSRLPRT
ncbi:MAG TPA: hypothetical protein VIJ47_04260 [Acidimicrobiales bacterium]